MRFVSHPEPFISSVRVVISIIRSGGTPEVLSLFSVVALHILIIGHMFVITAGDCQF